MRSAVRSHCAPVSLSVANKGVDLGHHVRNMTFNQCDYIDILALRGNKDRARKNWPTIGVLIFQGTFRARL